MACGFSSGAEPAGFGSSAAACGILVPQPGTEPASPTLQADSQPLNHQGSLLNMSVLEGHNSVYNTYCVPAFLRKFIHVK